MAAILDTVRARPALLSGLVAIAFHGAVVASLPHARSPGVAQARPLEVDVPPTPSFYAAAPTAPTPPTPLAPSRLARAAVAAVGGGASAPARALLEAVRRDPQPLEPPAAPPTAGDFELPRSSAQPGSPSGSGEGPLPPGPPGPPGPPALVAAPPPATAVDRSRPAALTHGESWSWSCPWPAEADAIDDAVAIVQITVDPAGRASRVDVVADPGYGFGREARRCALREIYAPALDREGRVVTGTTKPFRVRFAR